MRALRVVYNRNISKVSGGWAIAPTRGNVDLA